jgi:hypothetical protein
MVPRSGASSQCEIDTFALANGGFALLSRLAIQAEQVSGSLHALPVRDRDLTRRLQAMRDPAQRP